MNIKTQPPPTGHAFGNVKTRHKAKGFKRDHLPDPTGSSRSDVVEGDEKIVGGYIMREAIGSSLAGKWCLAFNDSGFRCVRSACRH